MKLDPRIPTEFQILTECYGRESNGFFSRGHMTRREDAKWGPVAIARKADADSFHVTNAVPQAQSFNAPIWLRLEEHLLKHARADGMKISVMTGPIFADDDFEMFGALVPRRFWKLIAFIHDDSGQLSVTAYIASQAEQVADLRQPQFVFGRYRDWQVPVRQVARLSGLDFDQCARYDVLAGADDRFALELRSAADAYTL
jgi:endonuclease G